MEIASFLLREFFCTPLSPFPPASSSVVLSIHWGVFCDPVCYLRCVLSFGVVSFHLRVVACVISMSHGFELVVFFVLLLNATQDTRMPI